MEITNEDEHNEVVRECIKLTKNTKGYNWELKIFPIKSPELDDETAQRTGKYEFIIGDSDIDRLEMLNAKMNEKFGVPDLE